MTDPKRGHLDIRTTSLAVQLDGKQILHDIDLHIPAGYRLSVIGPSGSGKTSLLRCLANLLPPSMGTVQLVDGNSRPVDFRHARLGFVFQDLGIFENSTVRQNVFLGDRPLEADVETTALLAHIGVASLLSRYVGTLSGGERQRVAVARAMIRKPQILFLDEPFAHLDPRLSLQLELLLLELQERLSFTIVYVSHNVASAARVGQSIAYIGGGRIHQAGSLTDLYYRPASEDVLRFVSTLPPFRVVPEDWSGNLVQRDTIAQKSLFVRPEDASVSLEPPTLSDVAFRQLVGHRFLSGLPFSYFVLGSARGDEPGELLATSNLPSELILGQAVWVSFPLSSIIYLDDPGQPSTQTEILERMS